MPEVPAAETEPSVKAPRKRPLQTTEDFTVKKKSRWGILTSQGSWADRSPLHEAACQGRLLALRTLLSQGYHANIITIDHVTPLHEACLSDRVACTRALLQAGANVNATTIDGVTPLFNACSAGSASCTQVLLEHGAQAQASPCQPSPIHEASSRGRSACLEALVRWEADVDYVIPHLGTALYQASLSKHLVCIRLLLDAGADVQKGRYEDTPLHVAAQGDSEELVSLLLEFGANANARNTEQKRPLETAPPSGLAEAALLQFEAAPRSLRQLCRLSIREQLGRRRLNLIPQLPLPSLLQLYLQHR
ncbi:ankyrin repeat and SOCS box protein 5b [Osmerus eperlanus]|uniref:ankyrin repeat and SOCS box protein 5b n=1 Tax=Osmerus eperlanus TaxID=29151 RepID=UPI002E0FC57D